MKAKKIELQGSLLKHHISSKIHTLQKRALEYELPIEEIKLTGHMMSNEDVVVYRAEIKNLKSAVELLKRDEQPSDEKEVKQSRKKSNILFEEEKGFCRKNAANQLNYAF